jgi:hypothetical protein
MSGVAGADSVAGLRQLCGNLMTGLLAQQADCATSGNSNRDLGTDLDHAAGRDLEIVRGIVSGASQRNEQAVLP